MIRTTILALGLSAMPVLALAQDSTIASSTEAAATFGPAIGEPVPSFSITDDAGQSRTLANLAGEEGLLVYFNRSLDWCPICLRQTLELQEYQDQFEQAGWNVAVLTYDSPETLAQVRDRRGLTMALLGDEGSPVIDAFDVRDPIYSDPDHLAHGVPYPIAFAIQADGTVQAKFWHEAGLGEQRGYATRVSAQDVLTALTED